MEHLNKRFDELEGKLRELLSELRSSREENLLLKAQISELQQLSSDQKKQIKDLEESNNLVKIAGKVSTNVGLDEELKKRIDHYILEIDKCISLLRE